MSFDKLHIIVVVCHVLVISVSLCHEHVSLVPFTVMLVLAEEFFYDLSAGKTVV